MAGGRSDSALDQHACKQDHDRESDHGRPVGPDAGYASGKHRILTRVERKHERGLCDAG